MIAIVAIMAISEKSKWILVITIVAIMAILKKETIWILLIAISAIMPILKNIQLTPDAWCAQLLRFWQFWKKVNEF